MILKCDSVRSKNVLNASVHNLITNSYTFAMNPCMNTFFLYIYLLIYKGATNGFKTVFCLLHVKYKDLHPVGQSVRQFLRETTHRQNIAGENFKLWEKIHRIFMDGRRPLRGLKAP